jgi:hypothetical protein
MACEISRPTPQALFNRIRDMFSTTVLQGGQVIPESNEWYVTSLNYAMAEEFYAYSEQMWKERDPRTACCENLVRITGTPGTALPDVIEVDIAGTNYTSEAVIYDVLPEDGQLTFRVRATEAGQQGNTNLPASGTLVTPIPGINNDVQVFGGFCGGEDAETCEQFRSRYLARKQFAPRATQAWVEQKLMEWPCVTRVCIRGGTCCTLGTNAGGCTCNCCGETLDYYVFMDNTFTCGIVPQCVLDEINTWMFGPDDQKGYGLGQVEVGVCGSVHPVTPAIINLTVSDYGCITNAQKNEIRERLAEFFLTLCPSTELNTNQVSAIVGSVIGYQNTYAVELEYEPDAPVTDISLGIGSCGVLEFDCDAVGCLGTVTFVDTVPEGGTCQ